MELEEERVGKLEEGWSTSTREDGQRRGLDIRKNFLTGKTVKHQNKLPRDVVESTYLEVLKDAALRDVV